MKKVNIIVKIKAPQEDEIIIRTIGEHEEDNNVISYNEDDVLVNVKIAKVITIERKNSDYYLNFILDKDAITHTIYEVYNPKFNIDIEIETKKLIVNINSINADYLLKMNGEEIGLYCFSINWSNT